MAVRSEKGPAVAENRGAPTFTVRADVLFRRLEQEAVLLDLENGTYFGLNTSGTVVWESLKRGGDLDGAAAALADQFGVDPQLAREQTKALLADLEDAGLLARA